MQWGLLVYNLPVKFVGIPCSDSTMFRRVCHSAPLPPICIQFEYRCLTLRLNESLHVTGNSWHIFWEPRTGWRLLDALPGTVPIIVCTFLRNKILIGDRNKDTRGLNVICFGWWMIGSCKNECIHPRKISLIILIWRTFTAIKILHIFYVWGNQKSFRWWGFWFILVGKGTTLLNRYTSGHLTGGSLKWARNSTK